MRLIPIAEESLGVRSMAIFVDLGDLRVLLDPGVSLAPNRFGLPPHPVEIRALAEARRRLSKYVAEADLIFISHYHRDHYTPNYQSFYMWTDVDTWRETYSNKIIIIKSVNRNINFSQRRRGLSLLRDLSKVARQVIEAEGFSLSVNKSRIDVLGPFVHGDDRLGYVVGAFLTDGETSMVYLPDQAVEDPGIGIDTIPKADIYVIGGPATYLGKRPRHIPLLSLLCRNADLFILAHHALRDATWREMYQFDDCRVRTYAELIGLEPRLLEASRRELYRRDPPPNDWVSVMKGRLDELSD